MANREVTNFTDRAVRVGGGTDVPHEGVARCFTRIQRQVFEAFELQISYVKAGRKIEISATVSEAVAGAFEKQKALPKEGSLVVVRDIAGARSVSRYDRTRIRQTSAHPS